MNCMKIRFLALIGLISLMMMKVNTLPVDMSLIEDDKGAEETKNGDSRSMKVSGFYFDYSYKAPPADEETTEVATPEVDYHYLGYSGDIDENGVHLEYTTDGVNYISGDYEFTDDEKEENQKEEEKEEDVVEDEE